MVLEGSLNKNSGNERKHIRHAVGKEVLLYKSTNNATQRSGLFAFSDAEESTEYGR